MFSFLCEGWQNGTCVLRQKVFCPSALISSTCTKTHFENILSTYMFSLDAALPQVSDKMKDKEIIRKDMKESSNSVLDLLVYSKRPFK